MAHIQETEELSSAKVKQMQQESDVQWADGYKHKRPEDPAAPQGWEAILQSFLGAATNGGNGQGESAIAARMMQAGNAFLRINEFWGEAVKDLPDLYQSNGNAAKMSEIFDGWVERYKGVFNKSADSDLSVKAEEIFSSWTHIFKMNQKVNEPVWSPLIEAMPRWSDQSEKLAKGDISAIEEGLRLWQDVYSETLGRFLEMPGLGLTKQHSEKISRTCAEFTQFAASLPYYYQYLLNTEISALKDVFDQICDLEIKEVTPEVMREIYKIWLVTSERSFHELFKRPDFCNTVSEVLNCMFRLKKQLNELTAQWCDMMSIPSSRDHDKMAMAIQDLRRKVHAQQKTISALQKHLDAVKAGRDDDAAAV